MSSQNIIQSTDPVFMVIPMQEWKSLVSKIDILISICNQRSQSENDNQWLDLKEVAQLLHVSERTILRYRERRLFPYYQIGKNVLFKKKEIEKFIETFSISAA